MMFGVLGMMIGLSSDSSFDKKLAPREPKDESENAVVAVRNGLYNALREHAAMSERAIRIGSQVIEREDGRRPVSDPPVAAMPRRLRVLVVEDDAIVASSFARRIRREGVDVDVALSLSEARASIMAVRYDIFVVDLLMGQENGADLVREIRKTDRLTTIIVVTGLELDEAERRLAGAENVEVHQKGRPLSLAPWLRDG